MWKLELRSLAGPAAEHASREGWEALPWRRILAEGGLLLAMLLTSSWLIRG